MAIKVRIPTPLMKLTDNQSEVSAEGETISEIINNLEKTYPGIKERLVDNFRIRPSISVAVDGTITPMGILEKVGKDSEVHFVPAVGGGSNSLPNQVTESL